MQAEVDMRNSATGVQDYGLDSAGAIRRNDRLRFGLNDQAIRTSRQVGQGIASVAGRSN